MSTPTTNYGFTKPTTDEFYDIAVQNGNWDKADTKLKSIDTEITNARNGEVSLDARLDKVDTSLSDMMYQTAGGTATALTLTIKGTLVTGYPITLIASANNGGVATTINGKKAYKPATTNAPTLIAGKAYTFWYNSTGDSGNGCFFIKASAEGTALAKDVRTNTTFSNDNDTGIPGGLDLSLLVTGNIRAGVTIDGIAGKTSVVDTVTGDATNIQILAGKKAFVNGALITGTAVNKAAATINPSTSAQTIAANTLCTGIQTIAATAGTANPADVVAGKTFNSASGIGQTGTCVNAPLSPGSATVLINNDNSGMSNNGSATPVRVSKNYQINGLGGVIRVSFGLTVNTTNDHTAYGQIYVNGVARGTLRSTTSYNSYVTFVEDIDINAGDIITFWGYASASGKNMSIGNVTLSINNTIPSLSISA